jgi:molybdopterin adenylyltransferase
LKIAILAVSDQVCSGRREDSGGAAVGEWASVKGWDVVARDVVPDDTARISERLIDYCDRLGVELALTTGGIGISPEDVTPDATAAVADKVVPGLSQAARTIVDTTNPNSFLSRSLSVVRGRTLIVNLPGRPGDAREMLKLLDPILERAVEVLRNGTERE